MSFVQPATVIDDDSLPDLPSGYLLGVVSEGLWIGRLVLSKYATIGPPDSPRNRLHEVRLAWILYADEKNGIEVEL
jgi:hypothetical protein